MASPRHGGARRFFTIRPLIYRGVNRSAAGELIAARSVGVLTYITIYGTCPFSLETLPVLSLFLFRRIPHPGPDAMAVYVRPRNATGTVISSIKNSRIPINPACRPSCSRVAQGEGQPRLPGKWIGQVLSE
jgi:hypothetical protein